MGTTVIIGDVHGCTLELKFMLGLVGSEHDIDEVVFVGDLMDKGPTSAATLEFVREMDEVGLAVKHDLKKITVTVVEGNHENTNFRFWAKIAAGDVEGAMAMKGSEEMANIFEETSQELRDWMRAKCVPYVVKPDLGLAVVHGGILPSVVALPLDPAELGGKNKRRVLRSMYIRYIDKDTGSMIKFMDEKPGDLFWADVYDGRFGHIYFGHQPWLEQKSRWSGVVPSWPSLDFTHKGDPKKFPHATGLDLGCVHGGELCAVLIDNESGERKFWSVSADQEYCAPLDTN